jgi:hypothetical protein
VALHKIIEFCTELFSDCPNITSKFRTTAMFKILVKQRNDSNKTRRYVHDLLLHQTSFYLSAKIQEFYFSTVLHICFLLQERSYLKLSTLSRSISVQNFVAQRLLLQVLHPPYKSHCRLIWNGWRHRIRKYGAEVTHNAMTSILAFLNCTN